MEGATAEAPVSTATVPAPQAPPEAKAPATEAPQSTQEKPLSMQEKVDKALKEFREKNAPPESKPVTEEQATEPTEEKPTEEVPPVTEPLEVISHNGKDVKITDVLEDAQFEVFANGEMKEVEGIHKLMDMASIGFMATKKG